MIGHAAADADGDDTIEPVVLGRRCLEARRVAQVVLGGRDDLAGELRYFEVAPGGWTTLERHEHVHNVMVIRGRGRCLVGEAAWDIGPNDLVAVPPLAWHQFRAADDEPLGFLCLVNRDRDRPQLPPEEIRGPLEGKLR